MTAPAPPVQPPPSRTPGAARFAPPTLRDPLPSPRIDRRLAELTRHGVAWISGPPGCGKTWAAAAYARDAGLLLDDVRVPA
jgi:ATP/maltotriose-dependent transcriptional regulator MalT